MSDNDMPTQDMEILTAANDMPTQDMEILTAANDRQH